MSIRAQQVSAMPRPLPLQATTVPLQATTTAQQLDITTILNMMIPMMMIVMMMKVMIGAFGSEKKPTEIEATSAS